MRVVACVLLIGWWSLTGSGCALFKTKPKDDSKAAPASGGSKTPAKFPGSNDPLLNSAANNPEYNGLVAGTVIDRFNNRPKEAYIRWVSLDDPKKEEAPIDVAVSPDGYFTIRGLQPNKHYKLIARAKDGERLIAGVTYVKAPDIHVLIKLSEDMVTKDTPPLPGAPTYKPKDEKKAAAAAERPASAQIPAWGPANPGNASLNTPSPVGVPDLPAPVGIPMPPSPATPVSTGWVPNVTDSGAKNWPPPCDMSPKPGRPTPIPGATLDAPARVPSCVLVGKQLINFALYDLKHQPWEFRQRRGKLVLLDFWGTMCIPCKQTIPNLVSLQNQYGPAGLEVVGIAYEPAGAFDAQARQVGSIGDRLNVNYRLLLGAGEQCPVRTQFNVQVIPTLVLLDENGWIIWTHRGRLDRYPLEELELIIKRRLGR